MERRRESDGHLVKLQNKTGGQKDRSDRQEADQGGKNRQRDKWTELYRTERLKDNCIDGQRTTKEQYQCENVN